VLLVIEIACLNVSFRTNGLSTEWSLLSTLIALLSEPIQSAIFDGSTIPGKLHSSFHGCNVSYGGVEHTVFDYYMLVPSWLGAPFLDFPAGVDIDGSTLNVCRGLLNGGIQYPEK
jgi:hypothetical protein